MSSTVTPAYCSERVSRPEHREGNPKQSLTDMLCSENGAENAGKPSGWNAKGKALTGRSVSETELWR